MQFRQAPLAAALGLALAAGAPAQTQPAPAAGARAPELAPVVVTATPLGSDTFSLVSPANVLQGQGLRLKTQPTLGDTLGQETGVSQTYFGPNSSRPIIRGLDGDRIRVLQNGVGVIDASTVSFDHAVSLEPLLVDRVEVVRGPAALLYGGNAVGGVVNAIDGRIAQEGLAAPVQGAVDLRYNSVNDERAGAARVEAGNERFVLHLDAFKRKTHDLKIPGNARTPAEQAAREAAGDTSPNPSGKLPNSAADTDGGAIGASAIFGSRGYTGLAYSEYRSEYGTVAEETVKVDLKQKRWELAGELRDLAAWARTLRYKFAHSDYEHKELDAGVVGTTFKNKGYDGRIELGHGRLGPLEGAVGVQLGGQKFSALGEESFVPFTKTDLVAGFAYEEWRTGPWKLAFGARGESNKVRADDFFDAAAGSLIQPGDSRRFTPWSGSVGVFYALTPEWGVAANAAYTERAPVNVELFANGPHVATDAFEVGNRNLGKEKSQAVDLGLRKQGGRWRGAAGVFYNRFDGFITLLPLLDANGAELFRDGEDRTQPAVPLAVAIANGYGNPLRELDYTAVPAQFLGFEADAALRVWERTGEAVELALRGDYTRAKRRDTGQPLPRIPPLRLGAGIAYLRDRLSARIDLLWADGQDRVPPGERPTASYTMLDAAVTQRLKLAGLDWEAFLKGTNLLNEDARLATSFLREIAPLGKRAVTLGLRGVF